MSYQNDDQLKNVKNVYKSAIILTCLPKVDRRRLVKLFNNYD